MIENHAIPLPRRLLLLAVYTACLVFGGGGVAYADGCCSVHAEDSDAAVTGAAVVAILTATGATIYLGKPLEPRNADECAEEVARFNRALNRAIGDLELAASQRRALKQDMENFANGKSVAYLGFARVKQLTAELRTQAVQATMGRLDWAKATGAGDLALGTIASITGPLQALGVPAPNVGGVQSAWGYIKPALGSFARPGVQSLLEGNGTAVVGLINEGAASNLSAIAGLIDSLASTAARAIEDAERRAFESGLTLAALEARINAAAGPIRAAWEAREGTFQSCTANGNMPAGTWQRPAPVFNRDESGVITGVL